MKKWTKIAAGGAALLAVASVAHLPRVRAALGVTGCPVGRTASPEKLEEARLKSVASLRTNVAAPSRPALGLALEKSSKYDARAWGEKHGLRCNDEQGGAAVRCEGALGDAFLRFDAAGVLVDVDLMRGATSSADAASRAAATSASLVSALGAPSAKRGETTAAWLSQGAGSQVAFEFRFADYAADITATRTDPYGDSVVVRERYRALTTRSQMASR